MRHIFLAVSLLLLAAPGAHAAHVVATAPIYNSNAALVLCSVSSYTTDPVTLTRPHITSDDLSLNLKVKGDTCSTAALANGVGCQFTAAVPQPVYGAFFCNVSTAAGGPALTALRITTQLFDAEGNPLANEGGH